jgi:hypothetical protein
MTTGATLALLLALTVRWQALVVILAVAGLVILGGSTLGPREGAASALAASPLGEIPE